MTDPVDRSRRAFLTGRIEGGAEEPRLGPSPPWLAGRISSESCRGCGQPCVAACPEHIIRLHPSDHSDVGLAYLDFDEGPCTFCRACVEVCPVSGATELPERALPPVALDQGKCLAAQGVVCIICVAKCPERALLGEPGGVVSVQRDRCTGCGACVSPCPVDALGIRDPA